jgi:hypothetical protein
MLIGAAIAALLIAPPAKAPATTSAPATAPATAPTTAPPTPAAPAPAPQPSAATFTTISGRPPELPLKRVDPRIWEARFDASLWAPSLRKGDTVTLQLSNIMVWMPMVLQSTWSQVDPTSIKTEIWVQGAKHNAAAQRTSFRQGLAQGMAAVGISIPDTQGQSLKWNVTWFEQCWSSVVDETAAARITWPAEWPAEVQESLKPQPGIESGHDDFKKFVDKVTGGNLRSVTPWIAAKELVRATMQAYTAVDADGMRIENGFPRGLVVNGAWASMKAGTGSSHDVAAACVAVLRTAGIPARVVLGMTELQSSSGGAARSRLVTWCEFFLPGAGWVPFNPNDLRGGIRGGLSVERPWPSFGTWDELNEFLPICYGFSAPIPGASSMPYPAGYVWTARGAIDMSTASDTVTLQILGRGRPK